MSRVGWTVTAVVGIVIVAVQLAAGRYEVAVIFSLLLVVVCSRLAGIRLTGSAPARHRLDVCPRCGKKDLAPDLDGSGVRHCWACGLDVASSGVPESS